MKGKLVTKKICLELLQYLVNQTKKIGLETNTEFLDVVIVNKIIQ